MSASHDCDDRPSRDTERGATESVLIVMARAPERGRVKTRLAASLGEDAALGVYRALLDRTSAAARDWGAAVEVHIDGDGSLLAGTDLWWCTLVQQPPGGLGRRLSFAARRALYAGRRPVIVGTDCADLAAVHVRALVSRLDVVSVAIGPAGDGGYWGIAVSDANALEVCFGDDLPWSTDQLLAATIARLETAGLLYELGPMLEDVDDLAGLRRAEERGFRWAPAPTDPPPETRRRRSRMPRWA